MQYYVFDVVCLDLVCRFRTEPPSPLSESVCKEGVEKRLCICIKKEDLDHVIRDRAENFFIIFFYMRWTWHFFSRLEVDWHSIFQMHRRFIIWCGWGKSNINRSCFKGNPVSCNVYKLIRKYSTKMYSSDVLWSVLQFRNMLLLQMLWK